MKVAIVHDSFTQMGGAERVVDLLHEMFPSAPVFTLVFDEKFRGKYKGWDIRTSPLQTLYSIFPKLQYLLIWIPWAVAQLDFTGYDLVISSSSGFVKNIRVPKNIAHICYCHTPPRFLWLNKDYVNQEVPLLLRPIVKYVLSKMRNWDLAGSRRVTHFVANSLEVQKRIESVYQRTSTVVHPGVDLNFWKPTVGKKDYFLIAGRLQSHKNNKSIVEIFSGLSGNQSNVKLHVAGTGRQEEYLRSIAKQNITFLGAISDEELRDEYSGALGFIYPQVEDFGLMPLEAAACGTATIAYAKGGSLETVIPGITGEFYGNVVSPFMGSQSAARADKSADYGDASKTEIQQIILGWKAEKYRFDDLKAQADKFSKENFKQQINKFFKNIYYGIK